MNYRVEEFEEFRLVGYKERMTMNNGENLKRIPEFWNELSAQGKCEEMMKYNDNDNLRCLGVCANADDQCFDYFVATGSGKAIPAEMDELIVPASTYAIFECRGKMPEGQQKIWKRIFTEWFPGSAYEPADGPQIEWYSDGPMDSEDYLSEIWIPVKKKS